MLFTKFILFQSNYSFAKHTLHIMFLLIYNTCYHSRFIPEGVAEVSQISLRDTHVLPKLISYEEHCNVAGGKPMAVLLQSISGVSAINPVVAF
jgi:hypothetical protein